MQYLRAIQIKKKSFLTTANIYDFNSSINFNARPQYQNSNDAIIRNVFVNKDYIRTLSYQNNGKRVKLIALVNLSEKLNSWGVRFSLKNKLSYNAANSVVNFELNNVVSKDYLVKFFDAK